MRYRPLVFGSENRHSFLFIWLRPSSWEWPLLDKKTTETKVRTVAVTALLFWYFFRRQLLKSRSDAELGQAASCTPAALPVCGGGALQKDPSSRVGTSFFWKCLRMLVNMLTVWPSLCRDYTSCSETCQPHWTWTAGGSCFCRTKVIRCWSSRSSTHKEVHWKSKSVFVFLFFLVICRKDW